MPKGPQSKAHRERAQPASRSRLGLLEKHSDYVQRAKDFHRKENRLTALKVRAQYKNPNEFAFGMINARTGKDGSHRTEGKALHADVVKLMKSQDLAYVRMMKKVNEGKLKSLTTTKGEAANQKLKFYDSDDEPEDIHDIHDTQEAVTPEISEPISKAALAEISIRQERLEKLRIAERELENQRLTMGRGKREKVGVDNDGVSIYKWAPIRKK